MKHPSMCRYDMELEDGTTDSIFASSEDEARRKHAAMKINAFDGRRILKIWEVK